MRQGQSVHDIGYGKDFVLLFYFMDFDIVSGPTMI